MTNNETWNTCPVCYKKWKDEIPVIGLLHRTRICSPECQRKRDKEDAWSQPEDLDE